METQHSDPGQSFRRRKARLACNPCRARKTGCDGRKPVCSACALRGWQDKCIYPDTVLQPSTALTLVDIDRRLQKLENEVRGDAAAGSHHGTPLPGSVPAVTGRDPGSSTDPPTIATATFVLHDPASGPGPASGPPTRRASTGSEPDSPMFPGLVGLSLHGLEQHLDDVDPRSLALPPRQLADDLLHCYWVNFHSLFPFMHWPTFDAEYRSLWKQEETQSSAFEQLLFLSIVNMVLALGSLCTSGIPVDQKHMCADEFYRRSLKLVSAETLDSATIPAVQLLLLRALYLYFADRADRCWLVSGAAVRLAIGMCLHLTPKRHLHQLEREIRRRVWFGGCVGIDTILSATFGRPGMIDTTLAPLPLPQAIDEEYLSATHEAQQPEGVPCRIEFLLHSLKLLPMFAEMRAIARAPRVKLDHAGIEVPDPSVILRLNSRLDDILNATPPQLRLGTDHVEMPVSEDVIKAFRIQTFAFRSRVMITRILLLRPSILAEAQRWAAMPKPCPPPSPSLSLHERFQQEICSLCLTTVHSVLAEMYGTLSMSGVMSAWYALHFTFASSIILLVASLSPSLGVDLDTEPTKSSWDRAMAILNFHKSSVPSAARAIEVLQRYRTTIPLKAARKTAYVVGIPRAAVLMILLLVLVNAIVWAAAGILLHYNPKLISPAVLSYTLGLRHALDADHISAIDLTTRRLVAAGQRPVSVGTFFSLGHSTVVIATCCAVAATAGALRDRFEDFQRVGGIIGTSVSAAFLLLLCIGNGWVLYRLVKRIRKVVAEEGERRRRREEGEEEEDGEDEQQRALQKLEGPGIISRVFRGAFKMVDRPWKMLPLGILFGLGFDTSSEIAVLGIASVQAAQGTSMWVILIFPALFTAGMCLVDTTDGALMMALYTSKAFARDPVAILYYSSVLTGITVFVSAFIGVIQILSLVEHVAEPEGSFWEGVGAIGDHYDIIGACICGLFVLVGLGSVLVYRPWRRRVERRAARRAAEASERDVLEQTTPEESPEQLLSRHTPKSGYGTTVEI
ncbi:hypothetical protein VTJ49DRAFT_7022 [Mycothermus thermophilus]|uniref:Zn(2)-C6 fungal-type domain-containing protein n=1 Tax=Humicola insolens TaxID=85995 RepID=A0ABR3VI13_HUMIN